MSHVLISSDTQDETMQRGARNLFGMSGRAVNFVEPSTIYFSGSVSSNSCDQLLQLLNEIQQEHLQQQTNALKARLQSRLVKDGLEEVRDALKQYETKQGIPVVHVYGSDVKEVHSATSAEMNSLEDAMAAMLTSSRKETNEEERDLTHEDIVLYITSGGGALRPMQGLVDRMVEMQNTPMLITDRSGILSTLSPNDKARIVRPRQIMARVSGVALSAAFLLTLAANKRFVGPDSSMLMHEISSMAMGNQSAQANHISNIQYATSQVLSFIGKRSGALQYGYEGTVNGEPAIVYVKPDSQNENGSGYKPAVYVLKSQLYGMSLNNVAKVDLSSARHHKVHFDIDLPCYLDSSGVYIDLEKVYKHKGVVARSQVAKKGVDAELVSHLKAGYRQAIRVCMPIWRAWVEVIQQRIDDSSTVSLTHEKRKQEVNLTDNVAYTMMRLCAEDRLLSANECYRMGFANVGPVPPQQRMPQTQSDDVYPNTNEDF